MNKCFFIGNLVRDPEFKDLGEKGKVVNFTIAVNDTFKRSADKKNEVAYLDMEAWASGAETINKYFKKGSSIIVEAAIKQEVWQDKEGQNRRSIKFRVERFEFPPRGKSEGNDSSQEPVNAGANGDNEQDVPF